MPKTTKEPPKLGSVVRIRKIGKVDSRFCGKEGAVVRIEEGGVDGPFGVQFPAYYKYLHNYPHGPETVVFFSANELSVIPSFTPPSREDFLNLFWPNFWHSYYTHKIPLILGVTLCDHEGCENRAIMEALVNIQGAVAPYYVCKQHANWHMRCCDSFPVKKQ